MKYETCSICDSKIELIQNNILTYCECGSLGIDCAKEYTNHIGIMSKEDKGYGEWYSKNKEIIEKARKKFKDSKNIKKVEHKLTNN